MYNKKQLKVIVITGIVLAGVLAYALFVSDNNKDQPSPFAGSGSAPPASQSGPSKLLESGYPSQIIDLTDWKLTIPVTDREGKSLSPDIKQPELATYQIRPWFMLSPDKKGVIFRAPVNAPTTSNSNYPRSELREMADNGKEEAVWSTTSGTNTLFIDQAITAVPQNKPIVVAGQIHGDDDDLLVIRLEYSKLYVTRSKSNAVVLDENYALGKRFTIKFVANGGNIAVYYNNSPSPAYVLEKKVNEAYFKVGVYTQSNCETEEFPELCTADNYGEVTVYQAKVMHE